MSTTNVTLDTLLRLYSGAFDPTSPLTNVFVYSDDFAPGAFSRSRFTCALTAGISYTIVLSGFDNDDVGATR
jgi:hypothetical protein